MARELARKPRIVIAAQPTRGVDIGATEYIHQLLLELRAQGTLVIAVHAGYIDTDMVKGVDAPKLKPEDVAEAVIAAIEAGNPEVLADDTARYVKQGLNATPPIYLG